MKSLTHQVSIVSMVGIYQMMIDWEENIPYNCRGDLSENVKKHKLKMRV